MDRTLGVIETKREPRPGAELVRIAKSLVSAFDEDAGDDEGPDDHQRQDGLPELAKQIPFKEKNDRYRHIISNVPGVFKRTQFMRSNSSYFD